MDREKVMQALDDSLKKQHCGFVDGVGDVYAVSEETIINAIALLKEQDGLMLALEQSNAANEYLNAEVERLTRLLKEQEELLRKKQYDINKLCNEISEWKHKFYDKPLKEQEAVEPSFKQDEKGVFVWCCGSCGAYMYHIYDGIDKAKEYAKFCRQCRQEVKWDD